MFEANYYGGKLVLHEDFIEALPASFLEKANMKYGNLDNQIQLDDIAAVGFKEASLMSNGFIQFATYDKGGNYFLCKSTADTFKDGSRNVFHFTKGQRVAISELKAKVMDYLEKNGTSPRSKSGGKVEASKQLKALQDLFAAGLISQEDFDQQAKGLL